MKYVNYFKKFVELNTKLISFFAFFVAVLFYLNNYAPTNGLNIINLILFFIAMSLFDMATTAINHYIAFTKEKGDASEYDLDILKQMKELNLTMKDNLKIIIALVGIAAILGLIIVYRSNLGVLLLGMLCFLIGILYSFGPKPIAYTPLGEVFSGGTMGVILPVIVVFTQYDHMPWELDPLLIVVFMPLAFFIGSILLANNICDRDKDINNERYTLAYYTGEKHGVTALYIAVVAALAFIGIAVLLGFLKPTYLILWMFIIPLAQNVSKFKIKLSKQESFPFIVKNYVMFSLAYLIALYFLK